MTQTTTESQTRPTTVPLSQIPTNSTPILTAKTCEETPATTAHILRTSTRRTRTEIGLGTLATTAPTCATPTSPTGTRTHLETFATQTTTRTRMESQIPWTTVPTVQTQISMTQTKMGPGTSAIQMRIMMES